MDGLEKTTNAKFNKADALISELTNYLGLERFADIESLGTSTKAQLWQSAVEEMQPHINGTMPKIINKSFPYEGSDILAYRQNVYNSITAPLLQKAIIGVKSRVLEKISYEADDGVLAYLKATKFENGFDFDGFMREYYYAMRVKDPNAILAIRQRLAINPTDLPVLELVIHASENIVYHSHNFVIVKTPTEKADEKAYYFYGKNAQAKIVVVGEKATVELQPNDNNFLPVCFLGGRSSNRTTQGDSQYPNLGFNQSQTATQIEYFYTSDFSYALPLMNKCEKISSQFDITSLKAAVPVTVQREFKCGTCDGVGEMPQVDEYGAYLYLPDNQTIKRKICPTCNGAKVITPLKTNEVIIPHSVDAFGVDTKAAVPDIAKNIIGYVSPPVENAKFISEETDKLEKKVQDALNLDYTNLNFAVSAESKKEARTEKETLLREIANSIKRVYEQLLKTFTLFLSYGQSDNFRENAISKIKVILPTQFITVGADEIEKAYLENKLNLTLQNRDAMQRQIDKNKNPTQTDKIDLYYSAAWKATKGLWLATPTELNEINLLGTLTNDDKVRATKAAAFIYELVFIDGVMDKQSIETKTNEFIANELAKIQPLNLPPLSSTDSTQP